MWVFDATPLIYLAKVGRLTVVDQLGDPCLIPETVYAEVVDEGLEQGHPDARLVERRVDDGAFGVVTVEETPLSSRLETNENLSAADAAVLACAGARDAIAVMDEAYGREVAATEGITTRGTAYLVLSLVSNGAVTAGEARDVIDAMMDEGWYCAPDLYARILGKLESLSE